MAANSGHASVVALLLATPGVDPTLKDQARGVQRRLRGLTSPHPSPLVQGGLTPLDRVQYMGMGAGAVAALLRADSRVAPTLAAADSEASEA